MREQKTASHCRAQRMDGIVFIATEEAVNPVSDIPSSNQNHAVSVLAGIRVILQDQSVLLAVADINGA